MNRLYPEIWCNRDGRNVAVVEDCMGRGGLDGKGGYEGRETPEGPCPHFKGFCPDMDNLPAFCCDHEDY